MRTLHNALAAAIALAFAAGTAVAATTTTTTASTSAAAASLATGANTGTASGMFVSNAPALSGQAAASNTATTTTTTRQAVSLPNATTVDTRNQQTLAATAGTHASGSTSAIDNLITQQAAAGNGATGTSGTTTTGNTTGHATVTSPFVAGYAFGNPSDVTSLPYAASTAPMTVASNATLGSDVIANAQVTQFEAARADANVNRAIAQVQRDRKRVGRNGQLLYSIAPRTNVDRSAEMRDDGPPPSLTGSYSTLTR